MIAGQGKGDLPAVVQASGWKTSKTKGWAGLCKGMYIAYRTDGTRELSVAMVLHNDAINRTVSAHSCRSLWSGTAVVHKKEYRETNAEGADIVLEPTEELVKSVIPYQAIIKKVELYTEGRMMQGDASTLAKGGWSFKVTPQDSVRAIASAMVVANRSGPELDCHDSQGLVCSKNAVTGTIRLSDAKGQKTRQSRHLGLAPSEIEKRLQRDETIYLVAKPGEKSSPVSGDASSVID